MGPGAETRFSRQWRRNQVVSAAAGTTHRLDQIPTSILDEPTIT